MPARSFFPLVAALLLLGATACSQAAVATPRPVTIQISGATSMQPVLLDLARQFMRQHPHVLVNVGGGGSALGETRAVEGRVTLGASTFMPQDDTPNDPLAHRTADAMAEESGDAPVRPTTAASVALARLTRIPIGIDGIAVIVHSSNPVSDLTIQQLQDVFSGRILDWQELEEPDAGDDARKHAGEILLISREEGSGTRTAFEARVMGDAPVSLTAMVMPTSRDVAEYVAQNPYAIGYVSAAYLAPRPDLEPAAAGAPASTPGPTPAPTPVSMPEGAAIHAVSIDGARPSDEAVSRGEYPLVQPLYLVSRGESRGWARQFVDFALSPAGQAIVDRYHVRVR